MNKTIKIILVLCVCAMMSGCASSQKIVPASSKTHRIPQAHIEIHKKLLSEQNQNKLLKSNHR